MKGTARVLVIDDDESFRTVVEYNLKNAGYEVTCVPDGGEGLKRIAQSDFDVVLSDIKMPGIGGLDVLREVKKKDPDTVVLMITAYGSIEMAVEAMREGAYDYVTKPVNRDVLLMSLRKALQFRSVRNENLRLREELGERFRAGQILGNSPSIRALVHRIERIAETDATVLVTGETGVGKDLAVRAIHYGSRRKDRALVEVNCASIPKDLLESELFGHVKGAFTGATRDRKGRFHAADEGSLFLDEVGSMDISLQAKLLRVLEDRQVTRVGEEKPVRVDVRILAATNADLKSGVKEGWFREDLYYRLNVVPLHVPPLRERVEDIALLAEYFMRRYSPARNIGMDRAVREAFEAYSWPGNVRELQNVIERMLIFCEGEMLTESALPKEILRERMRIDVSEGAIVQLPAQGVSLEEIEKQIVVKALEMNDWNRARAARFLQVPRHILLYRMEKYGIHTPDEGVEKDIPAGRNSGKE